MDESKPFGGPGQWFKGNLHCHSTISDGEMPPDQVAVLYRQGGYDFLALTEHDMQTDWRAFETGSFMILPGVEIGVVDEQQHVCYHVVGIYDRSCKDVAYHLHDPGLSARGGSDFAQVAIDGMRARGMQPILCHPVWSRTELQHFEQLERYLAIEIYNHGCHVECNTGHATIYWDSLLRRGRRVWGVAVDDSHQRIKDFHGGWVMVKAESLDVSAIMMSLIHGRFYSSCGPLIHDYGIQDRTVYVECSPVREIHFVTYEERGRSFVCDQGSFITRASHSLTGKEKYVRVECTDANGKTAWTNPIFLSEVRG